MVRGLNSRQRMAETSQSRHRPSGLARMWWALFAFHLALFVVAMIAVFDPVVDSRTARGTVVAHYKLLEFRGTPPGLVVRLEQEGNVRVDAPGALTISVGSDVELLEQTTRLFRVRRHLFLRQISGPR